MEVRASDVTFSDDETSLSLDASIVKCEKSKEVLKLKDY